MTNSTSFFQSIKHEGCVRILCLGDVVGRPGRKALKERLADLRGSLQADLVIINGENAAGGAGIDKSTALEIRGAGADVVTLGDHAFQRKGATEFLEQHSEWCIRPLNLPADTTPGRGSCRIKLAGGVVIGVVNLLGRVFLSGTMSCPFRAFDAFLESEKQQGTGITVCDFHAEATSEKIAFAHHVDGRASLVVGTHTHVQTADERVLPGGTGFISDLGMTGCLSGVIGMKTSVALQRFLSPRPAPYEIQEGDGRIQGIWADVDIATGRTRAIARVVD
jgi:metallophosphoesterase (TIGR00282 family)